MAWSKMTRKQGNLAVELYKNKTYTVARLAKIFRVSESTIRTHINKRK